MIHSLYLRHAAATGEQQQRQHEQQQSMHAHRSRLNVAAATQQVGRVLPGPAGKLQELAAAGALQQATPEALGLKHGSSTGGLSASQVGSQFDAAFLSSSWAAAKAHAEEDAVVAGVCSLQQ